jgi:cytosine/adenosine deaminase-related metal-dependent hydrolase
MDLIIRDARLRHGDGLTDIGIAGGRIEAIAPRIAGHAVEELDAAGHLTTPSFVEPHIHLDKVLTAGRARENATNAFETLYDMGTVNGARIMRRPDYGLEVGRRADLIVVAAPSVQEAYRTQASRLAVVHDGRVVARNGRIVDG